MLSSCSVLFWWCRGDPPHRIRRGRVGDNGKLGDHGMKANAGSVADHEFYARILQGAANALNCVVVTAHLPVASLHSLDGWQ